MNHPETSRLPIQHGRLASIPASLVVLVGLAVFVFGGYTSWQSMLSASDIAAHPLQPGYLSAATQHAMELSRIGPDLSHNQLIIATRAMDFDLHYYALGTHAALTSSGQAFAFALFGLAVALLVVGLETGYKFEAANSAGYRVALAASSPALLCLILAGIVIVVTLTRERRVSTSPAASQANQEHVSEIPSSAIVSGELDSVIEALGEYLASIRSPPGPPPANPPAGRTATTATSFAGLGIGADFNKVVSAMNIVINLNKELRESPDDLNILPQDLERLGTASRVLSKYIFDLASKRWAAHKIDRYFKIRRNRIEPDENELEWYNEMKKWLSPDNTE